MRMVRTRLLDWIYSPWAGQDSLWSAPRYHAASRDEASMRVLIRAELLPPTQFWAAHSIEEFKLALHFALTSEEGYKLLDRVEGVYAPLDFQYDVRFFWLWVWDEMFHEDLPPALSLTDVSVDSSPNPVVDLLVERLPAWCELFENRNDGRFRLPADAGGVQ